MIPATGVQPHSTGTNYPAVVIVYGDQTATVIIAGVESEHFPIAHADTVAAFAKAFYDHAPAGRRTQGGYRAAMARGIRAAAAGPDDAATELAGMVRGLKSLSGLSKRLADVGF